LVVEKSEIIPDGDKKAFTQEKATDTIRRKVAYKVREVFGDGWNRWRR